MFSVPNGKTSTVDDGIKNNDEEIMGHLQNPKTYGVEVAAL